MSSLYESVLMSELKARNDRGKNEDSLYYTLGLPPDCEENCLKALYNFEINNPLIVDHMPRVNRDRPRAPLIVLRAPELDRYKIYIPVTYYGISYVEGADYIRFVNCGTSFYYFKYNKKLKRYKFLEKKAIH